MELNISTGMDLLLQGAKTSRKTAVEEFDLSALKGIQNVGQRRQALKDASKEFEAVFIKQMIESMRKTVGEGGLLKKSNGEKIFESMLDEEWAKKLASKGGANSLGEILYRQLSRQMGLDEEPVPADGIQPVSGVERRDNFMEQLPGAGLPPAGVRRGGGGRP